MCGRFVSTAPAEEIARYFDAEPPADASLEPRYNIAPTNDVYAVLTTGGLRKVEPLHWGLVPFWAKGPGAGARMINARAETLATKNAYRHAFKKKRCIIPADGFYEWARVPGEKKKLPIYIHRVDDEPLAFAGLWEVWHNPDRPDEVLRSCTIITAAANQAIAKIHDRMPVMLPPSAWGEWLDPAAQDLEEVGRLLVPAPESLLAMHPVSTDVNNVRNKGDQLIAPALPVMDLSQLGLGHLGHRHGEPGHGSQGA